MARFQMHRHKDIVCFGGEDWWYHNHGHIDMQLMRRFAKTGMTLYVNSIIMQKPSLRKNTAGGNSFMQKLVRKSKSILKGLQKSSFGFWAYSPFSLPVHHISWLRPINETILRLQLRTAMRRLKMNKVSIVWVACPTACNIALGLERVKLVYQRTDRYEEYPNIDTEIVRSCDQKLKANADLTVFVNNTLYEQESSQCKKAIYLDHGVDYELFARADRSSRAPDDIVNIPRPIIGFFGGIDDHTSDLGLVERVVELLPEMSFVFLGSASSDINGLKNKKNVWMLGQKPYEQVPHYGKYFDVAIMPWRQNRWIESCNPIKLKEYLALGKPVVSTAFTELGSYLDVVYRANGAEEFAGHIKRALNEDRPELVEARRSKVKLFTWERKANQMLHELFGEDVNSGISV